MKTNLVKTKLRRLLRFGSFIAPLAIVLITARAYAQAAPDSTSAGAAAKLEIPSGSLLDAAPAFSQWVITFTYPEDREKKPASAPSSPAPAYLNTRTRTITTTKTRDIIHEVVVDVQGNKLEEWYVGKIQYRKTFGSKTWLQNSAGEVGNGSASDYMPLPASGFRDLDWVAKENYAGTVKYAGRYCLVFIMGAPPHLDLSSPNTPINKLESVGMIAFVDSESRLPVQVQTDGILRFYQFTDAPTDILTLPTDLAEQIKKGQESRARLEQRPPRPY